jgi:DNA-binding SARP family transcriptional activator
VGTVGIVESTLEVRVLGPLTILRDGAPLRLPQSKKTRGLLAYLALTGRAHRRDRLCSLLWDVADDPRGALRWSLSKIRPLVNDDDTTRLVADRQTVALELDSSLLDLSSVRTRVNGDLEDTSTEELVAAASTFRGELLEGLELNDFHEFTAWCAAERGEARSLHARILSTLVDRFEDADEALTYARELVRIDPLDEEKRARLVRLLGRAGNRDEALVQYESGKRLLSELGRSPMGPLAEAYRELQSSESPAPPAQRPEPTPPPAPPSTTSRENADPFVGREAECEKVLGTLTRAAERGKVSVLLISGEPGVGKTRLLGQLLSRAREHGSQVFHGSAFEAEMGRPYGPWIDALRALPPGVVTSDIRPGLTPLLPELESESDEEEASRDRLFGAVADLVAARARADAPALLVLDDVHWSDDATAELLHYVVRMCRHRPVAVVLGARDGELVDCEPMMRVLRSFRRDRVLDELDLAPLSKDDTAELLKRLESDVDPEQVFDQSNGNPLMTLELARAGADMTSSLKGLVEARISHLSPEAADVLRWGAVLGQSFDSSQLGSLVSLDLDEYVAALEGIERHALLASDGSGRYAFPHDLVRRVIYGEISEPRRRLMHLRVAQTLIGKSDPDGRIAVEVAHHASLGGDAATAARACMGAGERCLRVFAHAEAYAHARRGLHYVDALDEPERIKLKLELTNLSVTARRPPDPEEAAEELEFLAEQALDAGCPEHARLGFNAVSYLRWDHGDVDAAHRLTMRAELASRGAAGDKERVLGMAEAARCLVMLERRLPEAEALLLEARAVVDRTGQSSFSVPDGVGLLAFHRGDLEEAVRLFHEARSMARLSGARLMEFAAIEHVTWVELARGGFERARRYAEELVELGSRLREGSEAPVSQVLLLVCRHAAGEDVAQDDLDAAFERLREVDAKQRLGFALLQAALADLGRGDLDRAESRGAEALELGEALDRPSETALARVVLMRVARARGDAEEAKEHEEALGALRGYARYVKDEMARAFDEKEGVS